MTYSKAVASIQPDPTTRPWLRTLDEIEGLDLPLVGGKAFRLATLKQHGLKVPPGLVLTTAFFESQLQHAQLIPLWAGSPDVAVTAEALSWLADVLKTKPLAKELSAALNQALADLFGSATVSFAVRSSAIDEDQRDHTFAGVHLTELRVPRGALPIAITRCWASALSQAALEYRRMHGMSIQGIRVAVLIQPMLAPACSGVGFTVNPLTGSRDEFVVEASWGLGEAVVSGEVQPYFYKLADQPPDYPLIEQRPGSVPPPAEMEPGRDSPLTAAELTDLALQLAQVQALMGEAQDVEWARQDGAFFLLQTRPVAALPVAPQKLDVEWTRGSHPEFLPELPSPLFGSLLERSQARAISFFKELGLQVEGLGPYVKLILGRPYLNLTFLKRIISQVGLNPGSLLHTIGHTEPGSAGGHLSIDWGVVWQKRGTYWLILKRAFSNTRYLKACQTAVDEVIAYLEDTGFDATQATALAQLRQHERIYNELLDANLGLDISISAATAFGSSLIAPLTPNPAIVVSALALKGIKTNDADLNQALIQLSQLARQQPAIQDYLADPAQTTPPPLFQSEFERLLARYGHRAIYETDMGWPRYRDDPAPLLAIIHRYAQSDSVSGSAHETAKTEVNWRSLIGEVQGVQRWLPWRCWLAAPFIRTLRRLLLMRDTLNSAKARAMAAFRRWDLALGQKWVERGWLAQAGDIFWLTLEEVERTLMLEGDTVIGLSSTVQARKETYQTYAATKMPFTLAETQIPAIQPGVGLQAEATSDVLVGLPISPGQVRGTVLVLRHPDEFQRVADDIILVTASTDPAWLPLLHLASGLIVEMGGLLSHGSVIAREYGLPAVANIVNATQIFQTGDNVLVDGSTGVVQILEPARQSSKVAE
jgi:phosphohistidine swiveling domain-containing protein